MVRSLRSDGSENVSIAFVRSPHQWCARFSLRSDVLRAPGFPNASPPTREMNDAANEANNDAANETNARFPDPLGGAPNAPSHHWCELKPRYVRRRKDKLAPLVRVFFMAARAAFSVLWLPRTEGYKRCATGALRTIGARLRPRLLDVLFLRFAPVRVVTPIRSLRCLSGATSCALQFGAALLPRRGGQPRSSGMRSPQAKPTGSLPLRPPSATPSCPACPRLPHQ
jgi:hypothetical protein